ncbi:NAD(P)-binding protein [Aspergillus steynii IBT 23096]|uniref:NAD(P)-binding protein n=1 Tax=Aspergillus steynii IBT 23096 TaxID=1392250 RepID=A0A2I2FT86_9EURO|nr:NAD(P)-binding protein [Aspergillus steynii IBT 23096]PLB43832.1 NAD(P)-binding protein [Aspergillus steynii IBT 23096]
MSSLPFSCAIVTGGGGGLGKAMSEFLLREGKKVILAGRTESNLRQTAQEIGATDYFVLDTGKIEQIPSFIDTVIAKYPEVDCLINNAGVQRPLHVLQDEPADFLLKADQEIDINVRGPMHLALGLLEHFKNKPQGATIINVSSILAFVPFSVINPVYNGTKAWLHFWSMALRSQLSRGGYEKIKIVEVAPPSVATNLHRDLDDPDDNKKHKNPNVLSVEEFLDLFVSGLKRGDTMIAPGMSKGIVDKWYSEFGPLYESLSGGR